MKKRVIIGDIHGNKDWKDIIEKHDDADEFIFVGDYLDPYNKGKRRIEDLNKCATNFKKIVAFKEENRDRVTLLIGNHDYHYLPNVSEYAQCSRYDRYYHSDCGDTFAQLIQNQDIQIAKEFNGVIVSHAGISPFWYNERKKIWKGDDPMESINTELIVSNINSALYTNRYIFDYSAKDTSGHGESIYQSPLWIRPSSLNQAMEAFDFRDILPQVIGHTSVPRVINYGKTHPIWMVDTQKTKLTPLIFMDGNPQI